MKTNKPGKQPTKGAKQILEENTATMNFYRNMSLGATVAYATVMAFFYLEELTAWYIFLNILVIFLHIGCYQMMKHMSKPAYMQNNQLSDPGLDLNIEGGMGEHIKDVVILLSITQVAALLSNYFWFLLLLAPIRAFWLVWTNFLGPWFFQQAPEDTQQDEKKRKKLERKMKRYQQ